MNSITGTQLRCLRKLKDLKQEYVARQLGISQSSYSEMEGAERIINSEQLQKLLPVLGLTIEQAAEVIKHLTLPH